MRNFAILSLLGCAAVSAANAPERPNDREPSLPGGGDARIALVDAASMRELDCVEAWEQLCSAPASPGVNIVLSTERMEVSPYDDAAKVVFRVVARDGARFRLQLDSCESAERCAARGEAAQLTLRDDLTAVYDGPDPREVLHGRVRVARIELVRTSEYRRRHDELEQRLVPGGRCEGLMDFVPTGKGRCLQPSRANSEVPKR
jgi:hypothetical protein